MYYKLWLYASVTSRSKRMKGRGEEGHGNRLRVFSPLPSSLLSSPLLPSPTSPLPLTTLLSSALLLSPPLSSSLLFSPPLPCPLLYSPLLSSPLNSPTVVYSPLLPCPVLSSCPYLILSLKQYRVPYCRSLLINLFYNPLPTRPYFMYS